MTRLPTLMGLREIAAYYGVRPQLADKWTARSDFPPPREHLAQGRVWDTDVVLEWGRRHGRTKGAGPRPAAPSDG